MKSYYAKTGTLEKKWYVVDLKDQTLGRVSTKIARILLGKNKPTFTPAVDTGDFVLAINSDKIKLTGNKLTDKIYYTHTGYMGHLREITAEKLLKKDSREVIKKSVWGMLPKNALGRKLIKKLKIYTGSEHPHGAQQPVAQV